MDGSSRLPNSSRLFLPSDEEGEEADGEGGNVGYWPGSLAYGVLVNASAVHGAPIFMNLVNSAALQAIFASDSESSGEEPESRSGGRRGVGGEGESSLPSITIRSSPLPRTKGEEQARQVSYMYALWYRNDAMVTQALGVSRHDVLIVVLLVCPDLTWDETFSQRMARLVVIRINQVRPRSSEVVRLLCLVR